MMDDAYPTHDHAASFLLPADGLLRGCHVRRDPVLVQLGSSTPSTPCSPWISTKSSSSRNANELQDGQDRQEGRYYVCSADDHYRRSDGLLLPWRYASTFLDSSRYAGWRCRFCPAYSAVSSSSACPSSPRKLYSWCSTLSATAAFMLISPSYSLFGGGDGTIHYLYAVSGAVAARDAHHVPHAHQPQQEQASGAESLGCSRMSAR